MDFGLTEEHLMFKEQVLKFARREIVPRVQEHDLQGKFDRESWKRLGEFGILGLHFPEELGGSGADVMTSVLVAEALGEAGVDQGDAAPLCAEGGDGLVAGLHRRAVGPHHQRAAAHPLRPYLLSRRRNDPGLGGDDCPARRGPEPGRAQDFCRPDRNGKPGNGRLHSPGPPGVPEGPG